MNAVRVADVVQRIRVEDDQVGKLARLDRPQVPVQADRLGTHDRSYAQRVMLVQTARRHRPQLPVVPQPLQLPVTPDPRPAPRLDQVLHKARMIRKDVLLVAEPLRAAPRDAIDHRVRHEAPQLGVVVRILAAVEVVLGPRSAVGHQQRRRVGAPLRLEQLHVVVINRIDRDRVLQPRIAVDRLVQVLPDVERALGGRHEPQFARRHDDPLPRLPVPRHIHLDRLGVEVARVLGQNIPCLVLRVDHMLPENAGAGRVDARPHELAGADAVGVAEHVGGAGLRISRGGDAVGQIGQVGPHVGAVQVAGGSHVGMSVDETGHDRLAREVDDVGVGGDVQGAGRPYRGDAVVTHQDVRALDHPRIRHGDDAGAGQQGRAARDVPLGFDLDPGLGGPMILAGLCLVQIVREERAAERPVHRPAVRGPGRELAAHVGEPARGHGGVVGVAHVDQGRLAAHHRDGRGVDLSLDQRHDLIALRRHAQHGWRERVLRARGRGAAHANMLALVGPVPADRGQDVGPALQVDAVGCCRAPACLPARAAHSLREVGPAAAVHGCDHGGRARTVRVRHPDDLGGLRGSRSEPARRLLKVARVAAERDDPVAGGRPGRGHVHRRHRGQPHRRTSLGACLVQVPRLAVPG